MAKKFHRALLPIDGIHVIQAWDVADIAARNALVVVAADVGKVAKVVSTGGYYVLTDDAPMTWVRLATDIDLGLKANNTFSYNIQAGVSYTLALGDQYDTAVVFTNAANIAVTVPTNVAAAIPVGATITLLQYGAGQITIAGDVGVTLRIPGALFAKTRAQYSMVSVSKLAADEWLVSGDFSLV